MAGSHLLDALRCETDLAVASQVIPRRKGIPRLRRGHAAKIIGGFGLSPVLRIGERGRQNRSAAGTAAKAPRQARAVTSMAKWTDAPPTAETPAKP
jgi:hypothetical protein